MSQSKKYNSIDGLRTIAAMGILAMHVAANNKYEINSFLYEKVIGSFGRFVLLFMMISAFGMCCGYYERILNNKISFPDFYKKRFAKVLPFFTLLVLLDIVISPSINSLYEGFADITLLFGFLPDAGNISVICVGWFLGLIFVFYICFPFFCCLIKDKKTAWLSFAVSLLYHFVCAKYFKVGSSNILYTGCFFIAGGIIYLYREEIAKLNKWLLLVGAFVSVVVNYTLLSGDMMLLVVFSLLLMYGISGGGYLLRNKFTGFISSISMEIYLSHMVIFRITEKLHLNTIIGNGWLQFLFTTLIVFVGTVCFSWIVSKAIKVTSDLIMKRRANA